MYHLRVTVPKDPSLGRVGVGITLAVAVLECRWGTDRDVNVILGSNSRNGNSEHGEEELHS